MEVFWHIDIGIYCWWWYWWHTGIVIPCWDRYWWHTGIAIYCWYRYWWHTNIAISILLMAVLITYWYCYLLLIIWRYWWHTNIAIYCWYKNWWHTNTMTYYFCYHHDHCCKKCNQHYIYAAPTSYLHKIMYRNTHVKP